eukprot:2932052-Alexandrium_andersonii.AAC.1
MQKQIDKANRETQALRQMLLDTRNEARRNKHEASGFGRRAEVALASASQCSKKARNRENKRAAREAIVSGSPKRVNFPARQAYTSDFLARTGWGPEKSHIEPA